MRAMQGLHFREQVAEVLAVPALLSIPAKGRGRRPRKRRFLEDLVDMAQPPVAQGIGCRPDAGSRNRPVDFVAVEQLVRKRP